MTKDDVFQRYQRSVEKIGGQTYTDFLVSLAQDNADVIEYLTVTTARLEGALQTAEDTIKGLRAHIEDLEYEVMNPDHEKPSDI
jgi:predicted nuclease with TOPRIM domain